MSTLLAQHGLESLSLEERVALAEALWESVQELEADPVVDPVVVAELERRAAAGEANPSSGTPWQDVVAAARARWGR